MTHEAPGRRTRRSHAVEVDEASRLGSILGGGVIRVNSFHHQAIDELGEGLAVSARCPQDGLIEGVELRDRSFVLGVQWHPESFWKQPDSFRALFEAHVAACRTGSLVRSR